MVDFLKSFNIFLNIADFGQGKKVHFHLDSGKNYPFSALLSGKKGRFFTESQGKYFWGTAGNPDRDHNSFWKVIGPYGLPQ